MFMKKPWSTGGTKILGRRRLAVGAAVLLVAFVASACQGITSTPTGQMTGYTLTTPIEGPSVQVQLFVSATTVSGSADTVCSLALTGLAHEGDPLVWSDTGGGPGGWSFGAGTDWSEFTASPGVAITPPGAWSTDKWAAASTAEGKTGLYWGIACGAPGTVTNPNGDEYEFTAGDVTYASGEW